MQIIQKQVSTSLNGGFVSSLRNEISSILLVFDFQNTFPSTVLALMAYVDLVKVTVAYYVNGEHHVQHQDIPMNVLVDYVGNGEGVVPISQSGAGEISQVQLEIPLCLNGAMDITAADEKFEVTLSGLPNDSDVDISIFGTEVGVYDNSILMSKALTTESERVVDTHELKSVESLMVDPSELNVLQLKYSNGRTVRYTPDELRFIAAQSNDLVISSRTSEFPNLSLANYYKHVSLDVTGAVEVRIEKSSGSPVKLYAFSQLAVKDKRKALLSHETLVSTIQ